MAVTIDVVPEPVTSPERVIDSFPVMYPESLEKKPMLDGMVTRCELAVEVMLKLPDAVEVVKFCVDVVKPFNDVIPSAPDVAYPASLVKKPTFEGKVNV